MLPTEVFDLAGCHKLTNLSVLALKNCQYLRALNLDHCCLIDDIGLESILILGGGLEILSLKGLTRITDEVSVLVAKHSYIESSGKQDETGNDPIQHSRAEAMK